MDCIRAALQFNQHCPEGATVEVVLRSGERLSAKTVGPAFVWGGLALVELQGRPGPFQVELVRPIGEMRVHPERHAGNCPSETVATV